MKEKLLAVLRTEWSRLGLKKEALDRVASQRVKTIEKEEDIMSAAKDADTMSLLMAELQGSADAERNKASQLQKDFDDYKTKHPDTGDGGEGGEPNKGGKTPEDIAKIVSDAVAAAVKPVQDAFNSYKAEHDAKESISSAKAKFYSNKWTEKFKDEADDAWERASELNTAQGGNMKAEELSEKATGYFNKAVQRKGVDATKPFEGESGGDGNFDFSDQIKTLEAEGLLPKEEK